MRTARIDDDGPVTLTVDSNGIASVTLNRPNTANAMDADLVAALHAALLRCHCTAGVRVVLISGAGKNFCSGGDVRDFLDHVTDLPSHIKEVSASLQSVAGTLISMDVPVIAAVRGYAAGGGGMGLIGACDFVIAGRSAKFMSGAVRVGMIPDAGLTAILTQLVGLRRAMEITLTNPTLDAEEALRIGLVTRIVDDDAVLDEAYSLAGTLTRAAPQAVAECKHLLWAGIGSTVSASLIEESRAVVRLAGTEECHRRLAEMEQLNRMARGRG